MDKKLNDETMKELTGQTDDEFISSAEGDTYTCDNCGRQFSETLRHV